MKILLVLLAVPGLFVALLAMAMFINRVLRDRGGPPL